MNTKFIVLKSKKPFKDLYKYEDDKYSIKITTSKRAGGYNMDMIKLAYPDIDFDRFKKQDSVSQRITIRKK